MLHRCRKGSCLILGAAANLLTLLYIAWLVNYLKVQPPPAELPPESDSRRLDQRLERLETLVRHHLEGKVWGSRPRTRGGSPFAPEM